MNAIARNAMAGMLVLAGVSSAEAQEGLGTVVCVGSELESMASEGPVRRVIRKDVELVYRAAVELADRDEVEGGLREELGQHAEVRCTWSQPGSSYVVVVSYTGVIPLDLTIDPDDPRFQGFSVGYGTDWDGAEAGARADARFDTYYDGSGYEVIVREQWDTGIARAAAGANREEPRAAAPPDSTAVADAEQTEPSGYDGSPLALISVHPRDPATYFIGTAPGSLLKTTDYGATFRPVWNGEEPVDAITFASSDPDIMWMGVGRGKNRRTSAAIYRSVDGGETFVHMGLPAPDIDKIIRVMPDPKNADVAWVAARGDDGYAHVLTNTHGGGPSWDRASPRMGRGECADLVPVMTTRDAPGVLLGASQDHHTVHRSVDGGANWQAVLFTGDPRETGCVALATVPSAPGIVYAGLPIEDQGSTHIVIYRSTDGGDSWQSRGAVAIDSRPVYPPQITVDPRNPDIVYLVDNAVRRSTDGAQEFGVLGGSGAMWRQPRALWINLADANHLVVVDNDASVYVSYDQGRTWEVP